VAYRVEIGPGARRALEKLDRPIRERLVRTIGRLAEEPRPPGVKRLVGAGELWRVRAGDWRIIYTVRDERLLVLVVKVGHRREVYRH
jgi:mRNA interferase RelE/StbE